MVPPASVLFPAPYRPGQGQALVFFPDGNGMEVREGSLGGHTQGQLNFMDTFSWTLGVHQFKIGIDYRRLTPSVGSRVGWAVFPSAFASIAAGTAGDGAP